MNLQIMDHQLIYLTTYLLLTLAYLYTLKYTFIVFLIY